MLWEWTLFIILMIEFIVEKLSFYWTSINNEFKNQITIQKCSNKSL